MRLRKHYLHKVFLYKLFLPFQIIAIFKRTKAEAEGDMRCFLKLIFLFANKAQVLRIEIAAYTGGLNFFNK